MSTGRELRVAAVGGELAGLEWPGGPGGVVLLHGAGHNAEIRRAVAPGLSPRRVLALDLRGHGQTTAPADFDTARLAMDVEQVVAAAGLRDYLLVGHSWGANVAVEVAARAIAAPQGLVLIEGNVGSYRDVYAATEWMPPNPDEDPAPDEVVTTESIQELATALDDVQAAMLRRSFRSDDGLVHPTPSEKLARSLAAWRQPLTELYDRLPTTTPTLLVRARLGFGDHSPKANKSIERHLASLLRRHPEFNVEWFQCGHAIPYFSPDELASSISAFSESIAVEAPRPRG
jgi:pimeloyl-ACP methyl ester carboxylesterase